MFPAPRKKITRGARDVRIDDDGVTVDARDAEQGVRILWRCELRESGLVRQRMTVVNMRSDELEIGTVELAFPVPADMTEILTTTGHPSPPESASAPPISPDVYGRRSAAISELPLQATCTE